MRAPRLSMLLLLLGLAGSAAGQEAPGVTRTDQGVAIDFQQADLRLVVSALAEAAGLNVVYSTLPTRAVTLRTSAPVAVTAVRGYLESVLRDNALELVEEPGGLLRIVAGEAGGAEAGPPRTQRFTGVPGAGAGATQLWVFRLRHAPAEAIARTLSALFGLGGGLGDLVGGEMARPLSEQLRQQRFQMPPTAPVAEAPAVAVAVAPGAAGQSLAAGLQSAVQVVPDMRTNSLLIRASQADYRTIEAAIQQLDIRPLQVLIEVLIAEVRRDRQFGLGIDARVPDQRDGETGAILGGQFGAPSAGDVVLRVMQAGAVRADVVLRALAASSRVSVLSRPIILAQNNQEARILIGDERPFVQLFRALPTESAVRDQVVQYREVGTQLTIRPTINPDGYVTLSVLQEVSNATAETQFGAPVISTREAQTQLLVKDGHTVVIGGLVDHQRSNSNAGIPFLKDIPLLGSLFRSSQQRRGTTELFLFLIPHVLRTDEEMDDATRRVQQNAPLLRGELPDSIPLLLPRPADAGPGPQETGAPRPPGGR